MLEHALPATIEARLHAIETSQSSMNGALGLMLDSLHVQTSLLRELAEYARDEPGPSPIVKTLATFSDAIVQMGESIDAMAQKFADLPAAIAAAFAAEAVDISAMDRGGEEA